MVSRAGGVLDNIHRIGKFDLPDVLSKTAKRHLSQESVVTAYLETEMVQVCHASN